VLGLSVPKPSAGEPVHVEAAEHVARVDVALYSFAHQMSARGITFQPSVLPHVVRPSSAMPSPFEGGRRSRAPHAGAVPGVTSCLGGRVETPPKPALTSPGDAEPLPPTFAA
jgi:hypothetical protein